MDFWLIWFTIDIFGSVCDMIMNFGLIQNDSDDSVWHPGRVKCVLDPFDNKFVDIWICDFGTHLTVNHEYLAMWSELCAISKIAIEYWQFNMTWSLFILLILQYIRNCIAYVTFGPFGMNLLTSRWSLEMLNPNCF